MLNFGKVSFNDFANSTAIYKNAGYQTYYNFVTKDLQTFYTSDSQEFLVADENSYSPNAIVEITAPSDAEIINFYTPAVFNKDDVYRVNGVVAQVVNLNGEKVLSGWSAGVPITLIYKDNKLFYDIGSGAPAVSTNTLFLDGETVKFDSTSLDATNLVRTMSVNTKPANPSNDKQFAVTKNGHVFMIKDGSTIYEYDENGVFVKEHNQPSPQEYFNGRIVSDGGEFVFALTDRLNVVKLNTITGEYTGGAFLYSNNLTVRAPEASDPGWQPTIEYDDGYVYIYPESVTDASSVFIEKINATDMSSVERKKVGTYVPEVGGPTCMLVELTGEKFPSVSKSFFGSAYFNGKIYAIIDNAPGFNNAIPLPDISYFTKFSVSNQNGNLVADILCAPDKMVRYNLNTKEKVAEISLSYFMSHFSMSFEKVGDVIYLSDMAEELQPKVPEAISNNAYMIISTYVCNSKNIGDLEEGRGYVKIKEIPITVGENTFVYNTISSSGNSLFLYKAIRRNEIENQPVIMDSFIGYTIPYRLNNSNTEYEIYKDLEYSNKIIVKNGITSVKSGNTVEFSLDKSFFQVNSVKPIITTISGKTVDFITKISGNSGTNGEYSFIMPSEDVVISKETYTGGSN